MPSSYAYINARVRALKADLLSPEAYNNLLATSSFSAFTSELAQSPYVRALEEAEASGRGLSAVDNAIADNFRAITRKLLTFTDGDAETLIGLLLLRYDLNNLKAIARAKHAGRTVDDAKGSLMTVGKLKLATAERMLEAADLPAASQLLAVTKHPLSRAFSKAVRGYASDSSLLGLELSLDRSYYQALFASLETTKHSTEVERYFKREIDATNIRTALKVRGTDSASADLFISGGKEINQDTFANLIREGGNLQDLVGTSFAEVADAPSLSEAEAVVRDSLDSSARQLYFREALGIGVVVYYLRLKEAETARLRLLARGKFYGVPQGQLEKELGHA
ncbi:MAG: V-type ATPase subunit [Deinococcota bacterium]